MPPTSVVPTVAMMVANTVRSDGRVQKSAAAVASFGYRVVVLGISHDDRRHAGTIAGAELVLLPVDRAAGLTQSRPLRARAVESVASIAGVAAREEYGERRAHLKMRQRELEARRGRRLRAGGSALERTIDSIQRVALSARSRTLDALYRSIGGVDEYRAERGWRHNLPEMHAYELAFGAELRRLQPDVVHAHDVHLLGVAVRAADATRARGGQMSVVYDSHEFVPGIAAAHPWKAEALAQMEREYIDGADSVITVSPLLAEWLERDHRPSRPVSVVMNTPAAAWDEMTDEVPSLRESAGVPSGVPLVLYSGGYSRFRGVHTLVDAMVDVPSAHLVLVAPDGHRYVDDLLTRAEKLGIGERVSTAPFVEPHQVTRYLSEADVGVHPMLHAPNHEVALPNKYFEYLHAGLPIVVSDVQLMSETTRSDGVGEVFVAGDADHLAECIRTVLADPTRYTVNVTSKMLAEYSWEHQADELRRVYAGLDLAARPTDDPVETDVFVAGIEYPGASANTPRVMLGPASLDGSVVALARALEVHAGIETTVSIVGDDEPEADLVVGPDRVGDVAWQRVQAERIGNDFTHVVMSGGRSLVGDRNGGWFSDDVRMLRRSSVEAAVLDDVDGDSRGRLIESAHQVFVSSVAGLEIVRHAAWMPLVVPAVASPPVGANRDGRLVVHAPRFRGPISSIVDEIGRRLADEGAIRFSNVTSLSSSERRSIIESADVVVDDLAAGDYGVPSLLAMRTGRPALGHVCDEVRARLGLDVPVVEVDAENLEEILRDLVSSARSTHDVSGDGPDFVARLHDGRASATQLGRWVRGERLMSVEEIVDGSNGPG